MNTNTHPIEQEELMAHLDGELRLERATIVAAHLDSCAECRHLAADLKSVSQSLQSWNVELPKAGLFLPVASEIAQESVPVRRSWFESYLISWGVPAAVVMIIVVGTLRLIGTNANTVFSQVETGDAASASPRQKKQFDSLEQSAKLQKPDEIQLRSNRAKSLPANRTDTREYAYVQTNGPTGSTPMIVRTAALSVTVQEFGKARNRLDEILVRHQGYLGDLEVSTPNNQARVLKGTLRIPTGQMDGALTEIKSLGHVEDESQNGEEVTAQYVDLQARLANARHTEQRLTEVLQQRTGKLSDVLTVETEIARVRGEIEAMEAERKSLATQVAFATLNLTLTEDYKPKLQTVPPSTFRKFRDSAVEGYQTMAAGLIGLVNAALYYGPSLLFWGALAFFPARYIRRKLTARAA